MHQGTALSPPRGRRELYDLIEAVARDYNVSPQAVLGRERGEPVVMARLAALCIVRALYPEMSQSLLARLFRRSTQWVSSALAESTGRGAPR